jgi:hypothetical protein
MVEPLQVEMCSRSSKREKGGKEKMMMLGEEELWAATVCGVGRV